MSYLAELQDRIQRRDLKGFLQIWEEYYHGDTLDPKEYIGILNALKASELAGDFEKEIPHALELWKKIEDPDLSFDAFRLIIDLQNSNPPELAELTIEYLKDRFGSLPHFNEKLRLVGLRNKDQFKGAVSHFQLLNHMDKGKFVFHTGGWGVGEILDISLLREQLVLEFEQVPGRKELSFENAFKNLIPLPNDHFLARRFGHPEELEKQAKEDPVSVIRLLLKDIGAKTAQEIKDELCDWVISEDEWSKWWQNARAKIKKDTLIETPPSVKGPFRLRTAEVPHEERFLKILDKKKSVQDRIDALYAFLRDFGQVAKNADTREALKARAQALLEGSLSTGEKLQALFLQEDMGVDAAKQEAQKIATDAAAVPLQLIDAIPLAAYKKKALLLFRQNRADWDDIFLTCLMTNPHPTLRDLLCKELRHSDSADKFVQALESLLLAPQTNPEFFVWYFQKIVHEEGWPFSDKRGRCRFFESFLTLLPQIEQIGHYRDLVKRMHALISGHRFAIVRAIIDGTSVEYLKEILLLVSKSRSLGDHEVKILHSLAEVVQPSLAKEGKGRSAAAEQEVVWTTAEGYQKIQQRIQQIGTVETVENAREIEAARALGDLRENSEYKFALERRARLQGELKMLSSQINRARLITADDIPLEEVGIGTVVLVRNSKNQEFTYTLLGPWDADPDQNILSFQSKFAQAMAGRKAGETFGFQDENYTVVSVRSYLDK